MTNQEFLDYLSVFDSNILGWLFFFEVSEFAKLCQNVSRCVKLCHPMSQFVTVCHSVQCSISSLLADQELVFVEFVFTPNYR